MAEEESGGGTAGSVLPKNKKERQVVTTVAVLAGAYVLYRWWTNRASSSAAAAAASPVLVDPNNPGLANIGTTGYTSPASGSAPVSVAVNNSITDNATWTQAAVTYLNGVGYDSQAAAAALGAWLGRQPLDPTQQEIVRAAVAAVGQPPVGGPYPITSGLGAVAVGGQNIIKDYITPSAMWIQDIVRANIPVAGWGLDRPSGNPNGPVDTVSLTIEAESIMSVNPQIDWSRQVPPGTTVHIPAGVGTR